MCLFHSLTSFKSLHLCRDLIKSIDKILDQKYFLISLSTIYLSLQQSIFGSSFFSLSKILQIYSFMFIFLFFNVVLVHESRDFVLFIDITLIPKTAPSTEQTNLLSKMIYQGDGWQRNLIMCFLLCLQGR